MNDSFGLATASLLHVTPPLMKIAAHEPGPPAATIIERARELGPRAASENVRRACGADETLLSQVLLGLGEDVSQSGFWDEVAVGESGSHDPGSSKAAPRSLSHRARARHRRDGRRDLAERADEEYQQQVAIKLVRSGVFSRQVQGRLRMERQILATLQHPNIARLLEAGARRDGTPYLVMEYIDGEPIDAYCDAGVCR